MNIQRLEGDLWQSADDLRANSKLTASEYSMPVLGLIFLRHASNRFNAYLPDIAAGIDPKVPASRREALIKLGFQGKAAIYLPEAARFEHIASLPTGANVGEAIDAAMDSIEAEHEVLQGALPRGYAAFEPDLLARLIKIFDGEAIRNATGDVFGRIYEYFLNKFAMTGAQEGGEFFTPPSLVRMIVNVIEPDHGLVLDPACGSAGMFVQSGHFIESHGQDPLDAGVVFHGQEKSDTNTKLARMNLAVHGLDASNIRQGNTFYDQIEPLIGACDFVMANPPFNVDGVETKRVEGQVAPDGRLPFGLPGLAGKTGAISNANSLWIQYFYAYLNPTGRAGFVMASSASDAGNKDKEIREKLVNTGHVDVMVAIGNKFFYTRTLPCTLWFFDKGKPESRKDTVLMLDARNVYTVVSARSHVFSEEQLANLNAVVWLYRGQADRFAGLVVSHQQQADGWLARLSQRLADDTEAIETLVQHLTVFAKGATLAELNDGVDDEVWIDAAALKTFQAELDAAREGDKDAGQAVADLEAAGKRARKAIAQVRRDKLPSVRAAQIVLEELAPHLKATARQLEARHKQWLKLLDKAEKELRGRKSDAFDAKSLREAKRALLAADQNRGEEATVRDLVLEALKQSGYFIAQAHWLLSRFPDGVFVDIPGLCAAVTRERIEQNDWSLTPGRYVGVAAVTEDDEEGFVERMRAIHEELAELNEKRREGREACRDHQRQFRGAVGMRLGDAADMLIGFAFKSSGFLNASSEGMKLVRGDNVQQGFIRWGDKTRRWPMADLDNLEKYQLAEDDVVLAMDRPIVGNGLKMAWIQLRDLPSMLVQRVCRLRGKEGVAETNYIRYVLAAPEFSAHIQAVTTGANIPHISGRDIAAYEFDMPKLDEQRQIVAVLSAYDDLIATNQRRIVLLEEAARRLYREWFVHLRFPGHETVNVMDGVPEGWARAAFSDVVQINPRTPFEKGVERPFVEMAALSERLMVVGERSSRVISGGAKFRNGDTLLARITPCIENGKTGFVQFLESDDAVASGSTEFIVLRSSKANPWWVYCTAREENFREHAIRSMSGSDGRQRVNTGSFSQFEVLLPPQDVLEQFAAMVADSFTQVEQLTNQGKTLAQARDALLPKLMSGQLDVSGIPLPDLKAA